jgi:hypothetical protein
MADRGRSDRSQGRLSSAGTKCTAETTSESDTSRAVVPMSVRRMPPTSPIADPGLRRLAEPSQSARLAVPPFDECPAQMYCAVKAHIFAQVLLQRRKR